MDVSENFNITDTLVWLTMPESQPQAENLIDAINSLPEFNQICNINLGMDDTESEANGMEESVLNDLIYGSELLGESDYGALLNQKAVNFEVEADQGAKESPCNNMDITIGSGDSESADLEVNPLDEIYLEDNLAGDEAIMMELRDIEEQVCHQMGLNGDTESENAQFLDSVNSDSSTTSVPLQKEHAHVNHNKTVEVVQPADEIFSCTECSFETKQKRYLEVHIRALHSKVPEVYKCTECSYETWVETRLKTHCRLKHSTSTVVLKCTECTYETKFGHLLLRHIKARHDDDAEIFECPECCYQTKLKSRLAHHVKEKHSEDAEVCQGAENIELDKDTDVFKCTECAYETKKKHCLIEHIKMRHDESSVPLKCTECGYETKRKTQLEEHVKSKHKKDGQVSNGTETNRKQKSTSQSKVKQNKAVEMLKCSECSYETKFKSCLVNHKTVKHDKDAPVYKCTECVYETKAKKSFARHTKSVHIKRSVEGTTL